MASNPYGGDENDPTYEDLVRQQTMNQLGSKWNPAQLAAGQQVQDYYKKNRGGDLSIDDALNTHLSQGRYIQPQNIQAAYQGIDASPKTAPAPSPTATTTGTSGQSDPASSRMAPRIVTEGGQTFLTEHGNRRLLQGQEVADAQKYVNDFWSQFPTGFQPGVGPQKNEDYKSSLWGFDSPTGGRKEMSYSTPSFAGDIGPYSGYDAAKIGNNDSIKYRWLEFTRGLQPTVENLPEVVKRLNDAGIPAKQVGYDMIDFGLGEGPIDVVNQTLGGKWDWMGSGGDSQQGQENPTLPGRDQSPLVTKPTPQPSGGDDLNARIQALIAELINGGQTRDAILGKLAG